MLLKTITLEYKIEVYKNKDNEAVYLFYYKDNPTRLDTDPKCQEPWSFHGPVTLEHIRRRLTPKQYRNFREGRRNYFIRKIRIESHSGKILMTKRKRTFNYYSDPGHGWVKVPMKLIWELNLHTSISHFSYIKGSHVYLEQDSDLSLLEAKLNTKRIPYTYRTFNSNKQSKIRSYVQYFWAPEGSTFLASLKWYNSCGESYSIVTIKHQKGKSILLRGERGRFYELQDIHSLTAVNKKLYMLKHSQPVIDTCEFKRLDRCLPFDLETILASVYYEVIEAPSFGYVIKIPLPEQADYRLLYVNNETFNKSFEEVL